MHNAKQHIQCLKLKQVYTHFLKKQYRFFVKWFCIAAKYRYRYNVYSKSSAVYYGEHFQGFKYQCSLDVADLHWGSNAEPWIDRLGESGLEPVQEGHAAVFYAVECQYACGVVQVHTYPGGVWGVNGGVHTVVPGGVASVGAEEAPGLVVVAQ